MLNSAIFKVKLGVDLFVFIHDDRWFAIIKSSGSKNIDNDGIGLVKVALFHLEIPSIYVSFVSVFLK